jgi:hypothetical protein
MKSLLLLSLFCSFSTFANDISKEAKMVIFNEISEMVFFEDEGMVRSPENLEDFQFVQVSDARIYVKGSSYSQWDMKELQYDCVVKVLTKSIIKSSKDINVTCNVENENWPYFN